MKKTILAFCMLLIAAATFAQEADRSQYPKPESPKPLQLPEVLKAYPEFGEKGRLTFWQSLKCVRLTLWDEAAKRLITFRDFSRMQPA